MLLLSSNPAPDRLQPTAKKPRTLHIEWVFSPRTPGRKSRTDWWILCHLGHIYTYCIIYVLIFNAGQDRLPMKHERDIYDFDFGLYFLTLGEESG